MELIRSVGARAFTMLNVVREQEEGQAMVEYALILFLVSIVSIAVLTSLGGTVSSVFNEIVQDI